MGRMKVLCVFAFAVVAFAISCNTTRSTTQPNKNDAPVSALFQGGDYSNYPLLPDQLKNKVVWDLRSKNQFGKPEHKPICIELLRVQGKFANANAWSFTSKAISMVEEYGWKELLPLIREIYDYPDCLGLHNQAYFCIRRMSGNPVSDDLKDNLSVFVEAGQWRSTVTDAELETAKKNLLSFPDKEALLNSLIIYADGGASSKGGNTRPDYAALEIIKKMDRSKTIELLRKLRHLKDLKWLIKQLKIDFIKERPRYIPKNLTKFANEWEDEEKRKKEADRFLTDFIQLVSALKVEKILFNMYDMSGLHPELLVYRAGMEAIVEKLAKEKDDNPELVKVLTKSNDILSGKEILSFIIKTMIFKKLVEIKDKDFAEAIINIKDLKSDFPFAVQRECDNFNQYALDNKQLTLIMLAGDLEGKDASDKEIKDYLYINGDENHVKKTELSKIMVEQRKTLGRICTLANTGKFKEMGEYSQKAREKVGEDYPEFYKYIKLIWPDWDGIVKKMEGIF